VSFQLCTRGDISTLRGHRRARSFAATREPFASGFDVAV
jgi:hypothetical protein